MKQLKLTTQKGEFLVFHVINTIDEAYEDGDVFYKLISKLSDITDVQASEIVDTPKLGLRYFTDYTQSLHSLIKSNGWEITGNEYIFKLM